MAKIEFNGQIVDIPEADVEWFVKEKGAKRVGGSAPNKVSQEEEKEEPKKKFRK